MSDNSADLPTTLLRYLPDSELQVVSWDGSKLAIKVAKEIGLEIGLLVFDEVSHVNLPPTMTVAEIRVGSAHELSGSYFETYRPFDLRLDADERLFVFSESWGGNYFVIAKSIAYAVTD